MGTYIFYGVLLIGSALTFSAILSFINTARLMKLGVKTTAKIIEIIKSTGRDSQRGDINHSYTPVYEFTDITNTKVTFKSGSSSNVRTYKIGDTADIIYSKDLKIIKVVSFEEFYASPILNLCLAFILCFFGAFFYYN